MDGQLVQISVDSFDTALRTLASGVASFVPRLIIAVLAFIILWVVAVALGKLIEQIVRSLKLDSLLQGLGAEEPRSRAGFKLTVGGSCRGNQKMGDLGVRASGGILSVEDSHRAH